MNLEIIETSNTTFIEVTWGVVNIAEIASLMQSSKIKKLSFNSARGFSEHNLFFLRGLNEMVEIEEISIGVGSFSIFEIQYLSNLKRLTIGRENIEIFDFSKLSSLKSFWGFWSKNLINMTKCTKIEEITLLKYKFENFDFFSTLDNLKYIHLINSSIKSFGGISFLTNLETLKIDNARYLTGFIEIKSCKNIKKLFLSNCNKINDIDFISELHSLEELCLENCGSIETLNPIKKLPNLRNIFLTMSTKIVDGDMTPLIGKNVIVSHYKHYTHKCDSYNHTLIV